MLAFLIFLSTAAFVWNKRIGYICIYRTVHKDHPMQIVQKHKTHRKRRNNQKQLSESLESSKVQYFPLQQHNKKSQKWTRDNQQESICIGPHVNAHHLLAIPCPHELKWKYCSRSLVVSQWKLQHMHLSETSDVKIAIACRKDRHQVSRPVYGIFSPEPDSYFYYSDLKKHETCICANQDPVEG